MRTLALVAVLFATAALAQPMDLYGFGPRATAMGGTQAAAQHDFSAAYYNPALLDTGSAGLGFGYGDPKMWLHQTSPALGSQKLSDQLPVDYSGLSVGAAIPMRGLLKDKVTLGFAIYVPTRHVFRSHAIDENTAYFLRYDNSPERFQLALSLSIRPFEWLSIGGGAQVLSNYSGSADFTAVLGTMGPGRVTSRSLGSEVFGAYGPMAGFAVGPFKHVRVMGFWRGEMKATYTQPISVDLGTFGQLAVNVSGVTEYAPHQAGLGVAIDLLDGKLLLGVDGAWEHWSATPMLVPTISITLPKTLTDLGFDKSVLSKDLEMGFSDTFVARVGGEYLMFDDRLKLRAGYAFRPTPAPAQTGQTNFLDTDAHLISAGAGWSFDDPLQMAKSLSVDGAAQLTLLKTTDVNKVGNNKNPNYRYGGSAWFFGAAVRYDF
jgi:long-chain fatty acid transport protein